MLEKGLERRLEDRRVLVIAGEMIRKRIRKDNTGTIFDDDITS